MKVILNNKLIDSNKAMVSVMDHGFKFGEGIFETMRTIKGKPWLMVEHLRRLKASAKVIQLKIPYTNQQLKAQVERLIKSNKFKETRIRITCTPQTVLVEATELKAHPKSKPESAITYHVERPLPQIKSTNILASIVARQSLKKKKAFEALLVDREGNITEGSFSNVFVVKNGQLFTPKDGILEGTVRNFIIKKFPKTKFQPIPLKKLYTYDEIFITSSTNGVVPIVKVDGMPIKDGKIGKITQTIIKKLPLWN